VAAHALATTQRFGKGAFSDAQGKGWLPDLPPGDRGLPASGEDNHSAISFLLI